MRAYVPRTKTEEDPRERNLPIGAEKTANREFSVPGKNPHARPKYLNILELRGSIVGTGEWALSPRQNAAIP
jgi:hypothetical protein